jgi:hypothetical protein
MHALHRTGAIEVDACSHSALIRNRRGDGPAADDWLCLNVKARPPGRAAAPSRRVYNGEAA